MRTWLGEQAQAQADRLTLWAPVAVGCGAAIYFALPREPMAVVGWALLALAAGLAMVRARLRPSGLAKAVLVLLAAALLGFAAGKLRTEAVRAPVAPPGEGLATVEAYVVDVASPGQSGPRLLLAPIRILGLAPDATPIRVRMTLKPDMPLPAPGTAIRIRGMINPPPPPASPGAYDFARDAFFEGVGGVGFALTPPRVITPAAPPPWLLGLQMRLNAARWSLAVRIVQTMGAREGGLAAAMVTGHEAYIPKAEVDALRAAGLAHIISISGLHMAIVGGFTFAGARLLIAAWPWLALRLSGKKAAALVGLAAVLGYLALSGAPSPAQRAAITASVAFAAILVDRRAISLHTLAISALVILLIQPDAVTEPGFQMSFAATTALVALAEIWPRAPKEINTPWPIRLIQGGGEWLMASLAASFVAGMATGPFAMQHFNRVSTFGLIANLLVAPISSFLMMPALAVGAVLAPFGWGQAPLAAAGFAIGLMNRIASTAAGLPHAQLVVASAPAWALPMAFLGLLWLCLWRGPLRWLGIPFALAVSLAPRPPAPDAWVTADASTLAVRQGHDAVLMRPDVKLFAAQIWARRRGLDLPADATLAAAARDGAYDCDRWSCLKRPAAAVPPIAAVWTRRRSTTEQKLTNFCGRAEVIILRGEAPPDACPGALVLDARDFARGGSAELYRQSGRWRIQWAQPLRGDRPWTRGVSDNAE
ncbi:ComEC/Rec2 family competence protein [Phenylobacterium aquaticum]|uniref:ComEC/Rec2 family competence protein n=1 Tax=Phenylobacterium aquaticum TaxID=1763816 RepID=UPI0026EC83A0|nr:ComEC/Rec2 family competence protein [Phenylobacterium aquaticum]